MPDVFGGVPITGWGAGGLLALCVWLILTGRLVPRQQMLDLRADRDKWEAAAEEWQRVATQQGMTLEKLVTGQETANHVLEEIQVVQQRATGEPS